MKLTFGQIKQITKGAVRFSEDEKGVHLYRFTEKQEQLFKERNLDFYKKTFATAGVKFVFRTDSETLHIGAEMTAASSRKYFSFDVFADGKLVGYLDNFSEAKLEEDYSQMVFPDGEFSKTFDLGKGIKTVTVYLPWSFGPVIKEVSVDDGAFVEPVKSEKKALVFGDSITQGYDALRPSRRYAARIAEFLGAEEINKAIGAEVFFPELAKSGEDFVPDYITVAYGTNDWSKKTREETRENCKTFYETLSKKYPTAKIFAITPIWRKRSTEITQYGCFEDVATDIADAVKELPNVTLIRGFEFVPQEPRCFGDLVLHPSNEGFDYYVEGLKKELEKHLV